MFKLFFHKKQRGFTLIELVIVITLFGIIATVVSKTLNQGFVAYLSGRNLIDADWQARYALERMAREIHIVRSPTDISTAAASQFSFTDINGNSVSYSLSGTTLLRTGGSSQTLATNIQSLTLSYYDSSGTLLVAPVAAGSLANIRYVNISLTILLNSANFTIVTSVNLRDLL